MDRQSILGYILIFVVLVVWLWLNAPPAGRQTAPPQDVQVKTEAKDTVERRQIPEAQESVTRADPLGKFFSGRGAGPEEIITIETDLYRAELTTRGGLVKEWELKKYTTWNGYPVQLVNYEKKGDFSLLFTTTDGRLINTRELNFDLEYSGSRTVTLSGDNKFAIDLVLPTATGGRIVKRLTFRNGDYDFEAELKFSRVSDVIANFEYQVVWESGLRYAEQNSIDESGFAAAYAYAGKELTEIDAPSVEERPEKTLSGVVDWVAMRTKYFALALIPGKGSSEGAYLEGARKHAPDKGAMESYNIAVRMPFKGAVEETATVTVYLGPVDYDLLKSYDIDLEEIVSLGWAWLIRPISEYIMLPLMSALHYVVPNWGVVIILFSIIIKIALHPLTRSSMRSMKRMQALQPMMNEIREKYKDDPQKMNQQILNLYKEYGVNPAGGCFPILLQLPILIALYNVFRATIELRQASFVWWITDLSIPDTIVSLPFEIPLFGVKDVSGLALMMGITMFIQQKMTVKDPRQKAMVWLMPVLMTLLFNSFPSGLNLYYFVFNLLSIGQQIIVNRQADDQPLRKVEPKKRRQGGIFGRLTKDLPRLKR